MVKLYSTPSCGHCTKLKLLLEKKNISYTEYDVANDINKAKEMEKISGQLCVPVLDFNGVVVIGYNRKNLERLLV